MSRNIAVSSALFGVCSFPLIAFAQGQANQEGTGTADAQMLQAVTVVAPGANGETENTFSYTTGQTSAATGLPLTLRETPQSVTVVTRQRMDDQQLRTVHDVLTNSTGISANTLDYRSSYYARGFSIDSFQYDGIPTTFLNGASYLDTAFYDRIEIVRGSTGLLTGAGNPSASINLVRKRPTREFQGEVTAAAGSWDNYRSTVDLSSPLDADGRVRGRVVGVVQNAHSFTEGAKSKNRAFYGILEADLTSRTTASIGYEQQDNDQYGMLWGGLPLFFSDGSQTNWTRSKTAAADWSHWGSDISTAFATIEHRFDNGWKARAVYNHGRSEDGGDLLSPSGYVNRDTGSMAFNALSHRNQRRQNSVDVMASGPFDLFGRRHELVVGAMGSKIVTNGRSTGYVNTKVVMPRVNFYEYDGHYFRPDFDALGYGTLSDSSIKQTGVYTAGRFSLADPLTLIIGGRISNYSYDSENSNTSLEEKHKFTPYVGVVYDINSTYSAYASYTGIFNPQTQRDANGNILQPTVGNTAEIGLKGAWFDNRLNAAISVFDTRQDNVAQQDPDNRTPDGATAYYAVNGTKSQGFDIDVQGELAPGWNLFGGISHFTASDAAGERLNSVVPRTTARVFTTYRLPGDWSRLTVGAGVNWQSRMYRVATSPVGKVEAGQDPYALVSVMARYEVTDNATISLNVNNLFDKKYYSMVGFSNQLIYGAPRNVLLSMSYRM
ncbi:TonB-dependent siderophore receptor [Achromobacter xylosoxidans]|uniref:TonB-dependent siderophore receptor n=1 Tax=Alcaligenes xylosoxydans xylosoxydans TaxID=85698 RepID=UPI001E320C78|nr:TonB-dependent siderophore receptor [Achromobacter xylosoxidans]